VTGGSNPARICFVGDSYVAGTGDPTCLGWVGRACASAWKRGSGISFYNLGVRGDTAPMIAARWRRECEARLPADAPGRLVFMFGINDISERLGAGIRVPFEESVATAREIVREARDWHPTLWIGPPPANERMSPMSPMPGVAYDFRNDRLLALNDAFAGEARELDVPYLDVATTLSHDPTYQQSLLDGDRMHCGAEGYGRIGAMVDSWPAWRRLVAGGP
jgi:lysophospholipase L1-like esterase